MNKKQFIEKYRDVKVKFVSIEKSWLQFTNEELNIKIVAPYSVKDSWDCFEEEEIWKFDGYDFFLNKVYIYHNNEKIVD